MSDAAGSVEAQVPRQPGQRGRRDGGPEEHGHRTGRPAARLRRHRGRQTRRLPQPRRPRPDAARPRLRPVQGWPRLRFETQDFRPR